MKLEKLEKLNIVEVIAYDSVDMFNMAMQVLVNLNNNYFLKKSHLLFSLFFIASNRILFRQ